jgi:branched-chain amino acid transport system ATP-binding protein
MLEANNLSVHYGRHQAVDGASVCIEKREIVVMLGANGAGKSTFLRALAGLIPTNAECSITIDGRNITHQRPDAIVEAGVALVPEDRGIFADLSVRENLVLGAYPKRARARQKDNLELVFGLFPKLAERQTQLVRTMSGGEQQMVAVGRAMMSDPEILMLDEPSLGLSPILCSELFQTLARIKQTGVGIFLVEQNAKQSLAIADRGYLIDNGHITQEASANALANDPAVIHAYLGGEAETKPRRIKIAAPPPMAPLGTGAKTISTFGDQLAKRAAGITAAYIRSVRLAANLPSAFVGRYDRDADLADPSVPSYAGLRPVAPETTKLAATAESLAKRAAELHSEHIRTRRLSHALTGRSVPVADPASPGQLPRAGALSDMAASFAERAAALHKKNVGSARGRDPLPSAFSRRKATAQPEDKAKPLAKPVSWGVNKSLAKRKSKPAKAKRASDKPANGAAPTITTDELAARAARAHAAQVKAARSTDPEPSAFAGKRKLAVRKSKSIPKTNGASAKPRRKSVGAKHGKTV